jgi:glycosyltransferase involved in cell wall biosynthesis
MRIAIVKPEWHVVGGYELMLEHVHARLSADGHDVSWVLVEATGASRTPFGVGIPLDKYAGMHNFFRYMALVEAFDAMQLSEFDLVISTQPPSFAVNHPRHLAIFCHYERIYYELADIHVAGGAPYPEAHREAVRLVRAVDAVPLAGVRYFMAAGEEVRDRLARFSGLTDNVGVCDLGVGLAADPRKTAESDRFEHILCVSRQEFVKRPELFVAAMKRLRPATGLLVGDGARLPYIRRVDHWLSESRVDLDAIDERGLWLSQGDLSTIPAGHHAASNVRIPGRVTDQELNDLYRDALCVVAPAYAEDYGLTVIEAMAYGKPVVVCEDGGNLPRLVQDGVTGFVVPPTGAGIAGAIARFRDDPDLAREMGRHARESAARYTWDRAMEQIQSGIDIVMS